ncbi:hypothetical protein [Ureaplasma diversum]|uniref:Lipoprotein n=1 Tax=Ureaplasma diversum NCTC 246 TaxID=1188241 RepID=A0A084EYI2_9BACT|nr:hypothetical protein [Ureaplasma diversum]KEZ23024.1 Hypothetical protein, predicted lipoprotein [Ureaplasma diversum NCTC 246]
MKLKHKWLIAIGSIGFISIIGFSTLASCSINTNRISLINKTNFSQASLAYELVDWHQDFNVAFNNLIVENKSTYSSFSKQKGSNVINNQWAAKNVSLITNESDFNRFFNIKNNKYALDLKNKLSNIDFNSQSLLIIKNISTIFSKAVLYDLSGYFINDFSIINNQIQLNLREYYKNKYFGTKTNQIVQRSYYLVVNKNLINKDILNQQIVYKIIK